MSNSKTQTLQQWLTIEHWLKNTSRERIAMAFEHLLTHRTECTSPHLDRRDLNSMRKFCLATIAHDEETNG